MTPPQASSVLPVPAADSGGLRGFEEAVNDVVGPFADWLSSVVFYAVPLPGGSELPLVVLWLVAAGVIITAYLGVVQVRGARLSLEVVRGKFSRPDDPGEITHFQALSSALSGTVGLGNIAGVGAALALGGAGATFWMVICGLLGMATKFAECTLGVKYRTVNPDGSISGGPFKYLPVAYGRFGRVPAAIMTGAFAIAIFFFGVGGGNMFQANQTFAQAREVTGGADGFLGSDGSALVFGLALAALIGAVILGGITSIAAVTSKLVPVMGIGYVAACLLVIGSNISQVPGALGDIVSGAFTPEAGLGGLVGVLIVGFQRAAFSNEAGLGSAPIAHSAVKTTRPVSEGFVALLEPFIDTVIVCTMTALTIVIANPPSWREGIDQVKAGGGAPDGVLLTSDAFATFLPQFPVILAVMVALFAFSTLITWSYYGEKAWEYFFGPSRPSLLTYKLIFVSFTVIGTVLTFGSVLTLTDAFLFMCGFINLLGLYFLLPELKSEMRDYLADWRSGRLYELGAADEAELSAIREEQGNTGDLPQMRTDSAHDGGLSMEERARGGARADED
ncbi:amino acid carrier protein [Janibacter melonis]|uniref:Amino acid carrier protein n=1 Tax=Janibacter melonis TaxID=262209 RepID=A0A5P8FP39_9MICO|nr:alanine/glycine:cation symporter family protein [Janibacter melonis]QFQ31357.2 amino acid carrier protein [Janibacter melonis]